MTEPRPVIAVIGGTGKEGSGLALRWAMAGYPVIIGSRDAARAQATARGLEVTAAEHVPALGDELDSAELARRLAHAAEPRPALRGMANEDAVRACAIAVLAVPYAAQLATLAPLKAALTGKILVDVTAPLVPPRVSRVQLPDGGSAVVRAQAMLGDGVRVVSAFQNIAAQHLADPDHPIDCDVLVCGDDRGARETVIGLAEAAGMRGWHAGPLANSAAAEALTSVLVSINRTYKIAGAGIRITGGPGSAGAKG